MPISTVKKVLEANCIRRTSKYIPVNSLWITKSFIQLANNESEKTCLTTDCTGFNPNGPGSFRTDAANPESQICFFNKADEDTLFSVFVSKRIKKESDPNKTLFEIEGLKTQADNETYSASAELENLQGNGLSNAFLESTEVSRNQLVQGFFQDNNDDPKKIKLKSKAKAARKAKTPYSPTKIKPRNFLSNVSYRRICDKDFSNACFLIDVFVSYDGLKALFSDKHVL